MTTSGTVATTVIETVKVIEHAARRCGKTASSLTPEILEFAQDNLFLSLLALSNSGYLIWCLERDYIGLNSYQPTYSLPAGTLDVVNLLYSQPSPATGTNTILSNGISTDLGEATLIARAGVQFSAVTSTDTITLQYSSDNVSWTTVGTVSSTNQALATSTWYWVDCSVKVTARYWRATTASASTVSTFYLATLVTDIPIIPFNKDDWYNLSNKAQQGRPCVNYYLEKLMAPQITLWPVPNNNTDHLTLLRQRQIQDVGTLSQTIEVPLRRYESIIWELAERLAFEMKDVDPERRKEVIDANARMREIADDGETDNASTRLTPMVGGYTK